MAYQKINFLDQNVERPRTYEMQENSDGTVTLVDSFGIITEIGTPINRENMNHIEDGIIEVENNKMNKDFSNATTQPWNDRLKTDLSNITTASKQTITSFAMPSNRYTDIAWSSGATYTAPTDGYYAVWGHFAEGGFAIYNTTTNLGNSCFNNSGAQNYGKSSVPVKKGQQIQTYYRGGSIDGFRFVYAEGAE